MNLSICFDKNYQKWVTICLNSVLNNYSGNSVIRLIIISDIKTNEIIPPLKRILNSFDYTIDNPGDKFKNLPTGFHFNETTYWRLALPDVLNKYQIKKALYLDTDTLILGDLSDLYAIDLEDKSCGGCLDIGSEDHVQRMSLHQGFAINGGVLLMDVTRMNQINWIKEANRLNEEGRIEWVDQDVINMLLDGEIKLLDLSWNVQSGNFHHGYTDKVNVVHFTMSGFTKPWNTRSKHPYLGVYNTYIRESGFWIDYLKLETIRRLKKFFN